MEVQLSSYPWRRPSFLHLFGVPIALEGRTMASNLVIDHEVDVPLLLEYPTEALLPILHHLKGWNQVQALVVSNNHAHLSVEFFDSKHVKATLIQHCWIWIWFVPQDNYLNCCPRECAVLDSYWAYLSQAEEEDLEPWQISGAMTNIIFRCQNVVTNQVRACSCHLA